jgi:hypothetical protein
MADTDAAFLSRAVGNFDQSQSGLSDNAAYYDAAATPTTVGLSTPPEMRRLVGSIGWSRTYLGALEERLDLEGFRLAGASEADDRLWQWWQANNLDEGSSFGHTEAMIHGRAYIVGSAPDPQDPTDDPDVPHISIEPPTRMWADIDRRTGRVRYAVRVLRDEITYARDNPMPDYVTLYRPNATTGYEQGGPQGWKVDFNVEHNLGVTPVVPLLNRSRLTEIYGSSEITPEIRSVSDAAARTMMNMQATAELMAVPQRLLFGVKPEDLTDDPTNSYKVFQAYIARILAFDDPDGKAQQFSAAELRNFTEVLDQLAKQAATYTGLPPQYLTFHSDNPASAEAIRASESRLVKKAERKQRIFGAAWEQAMRIALLIMDGSIPAGAHRMESLWRDPATPTYAAKADAVVKLATAATPDGRPVIPVQRARVDLGYSVEERREMEAWDSESSASQLASLVLPRVQQPGEPGGPPADDAA